MKEIEMIVAALLAENNHDGWNVHLLDTEIEDRYGVPTGVVTANIGEIVNQLGRDDSVRLAFARPSGQRNHFILDVYFED